MNPITIPNISIPTIGIPTIGIPSVGFPSASGGGGLSWPAGMKEHIKAWYDPKKQGMTNFDVIESYVTDFTTWRTADKNYVGLTIRSSSFSISFNKVSNHVIMWKPNYLFNEEGQVKLQVSGITNNISIIIKHGTQEFPIVNGVNTFSFTQEENKSLSFVCKNVFQDTNITITQLPTSILKDLSGNGNHAYLYGGKGKLNSGMGVYQQDFSNVRGVTTVSANGFELFREGTGGTYLARISIGYWNNKECKLLFETNNTSNLYYIRYRKANNDIVTSVRLHNGENIIPAQDDLADVSEVIFEGALRDNEYIRVTEIPDCPDQLCYDGKMYAVAYEFPILTDYTVMAERTWFENRNVFLAKGNITTEAKYAFIFERFKPDGVMTVQSFGAWNDVVSTTDSCISYLTKNKYNGIDIRSGIGADDDMLSIGGALNKGNIELTSVCCHGAIIIADRSFTEEEINWLKQNWDKI